MANLNLKIYSYFLYKIIIRSYNAYFYQIKSIMLIRSI
jgi:hypothetical protein